MGWGPTAEPHKRESREAALFRVVAPEAEAGAPTACWTLIADFTTLRRMTSADLIITTRENGFQFAVRVQPRASRNAVEAIREGRLVVRVTAPPVDDAANEAVVLVLARALDIPRRAVQIVTGHTSRQKTVMVTGLDPATLRDRLAQCCNSRL